MTDEPNDLDLLLAREIVAVIYTRLDYEKMPMRARNGEYDGDTDVQAALAGIKKGREMK